MNKLLLLSFLLVLNFNLSAQIDLGDIFGDNGINIQIGGNNGNNGNNNGNGQYGNKRACSPQDFNYVYNAIKSETFASDRLSTGRRLISRFYFSSQQVAQLMSAYDYDNDRLEMAKFAYAYTVDPQYYDIVGNSLDYKSTARELQEYVDSIR